MADLLLIEDNRDLALGLSMMLEFEGHSVTRAEDGVSGLRLAKETNPDLIILDLMLPEKGGHQVLQELRLDGIHTPVLILTAKSEEMDVVMGFELGADDYLTKPFSTLELQARVRALLRRVQLSQSGRQPSRPVCRFGDVEVFPESRTVTRSGEAVELSPKEFELLLALFDRGGSVASRTELLKEVWRYEYAEIHTRTVDVHIRELRRKLEPDPATPQFILTVRKAGYRLKT